MGLPFSPAEWLASFEKVGGAYAVTGERLYLWIIPGDLDFDDLGRARTLVVELTSTQRASVVEHLRSAALVEG
jgi:hypothetical protein